MKKKFIIQIVQLVLFFAASRNSEAQTIIPVTHFKQFNSTWASDQLGSCTDLMSQSGCAVTCAAILLSANCVNVNPGQLNTWLTNNCGYEDASGNLCTDCNMLFYQPVPLYPGATLVWNGNFNGTLTQYYAKLVSEINLGNPVIVHVDHEYGGTGVCNHYVVVYGYNNNGTTASDFLVSDPGSSNCPTGCNLSYYNLCSGSSGALRIFHNVSCTPHVVTFQKAIGTGCEDARTIIQTSEGDYVYVGVGCSPQGDNDCYFVKIDSTGGLLWSKDIGGSYSDIAESIQQTSDGGFIIGGETTSFGAGSDDAFLIKTDSNGDTTWTKCYGTTDQEDCHCVRQTTDGGYILVGSTTSNNNYNIYLIKTDGNGNILWTKTFGGSNWEWGGDIRQTTDGGYIIAGYTQSFGAGNSDAYLIKTDGSGNLIWSTTFGGINSDFANSIRETADGGYIIAGGTMSYGAGNRDAFLLKVNSGGSLVWAKTYGGSAEDVANCVQQTMDGGYIVAGSFMSFSAGYSDATLFKTDSNGNLVWSFNYGGADADYSNYVQQVSDGGYVMAGRTQTYGPGFLNTYIIKTDNAGNSGCNQSSLNLIQNSPTIQSSTPATQLYSSGGVSSTSTSNITTAGTVTTPCSTVNTQEITFSTANIFVYPNPSQGIFTVNSRVNEVEISIYNTLGERIFHANSPQLNDSRIDLSNQPNGLYIMNIKTKDQSFIQKLIISH